jgi:hypothetical protein
MLKLYGNLRSRATRCIWMLEEMGEPYELNRDQRPIRRPAKPSLPSP